ncbi:MAG TPA: carbohydrate-binding protein, partial [Tepidisphaeraceae bacterium]
MQVFESLESRMLLAAGALDPTFGSGGKVLTGFAGTAFAGARDAALQSDGKIVVLTEDNDPASARLVRFSANGQADNTFASGGAALLGFQPAAFAVRTDNKIVVAGYDPANLKNLLLARFNANGQVDTSFGGGDGQVSQPYFGGDQTGSKTVNKILVRPDNNRVYVLGDVDRFSSGLTQFALSAFDDSGDPYAQFGDQYVNGTTTEFGYTNHLTDAVLTSDGHIVAVGTMTVSDSHHPNVQQDFAVARYDEHGLLDSSFSGDGKLLIDFGDYPRSDPNSETDDAFDFAQSATLDPAGNLLVVGYSHDPTDNDPFYTAVARVKPDGNLDATFGPGGADGDGRVTLALTAQSFPQHEIAALSNGKLLLGTEVPGADGEDFGLARLKADGSLDGSFGSAGVARTDFEGIDLPNRLLIQSGDRAILAGSSVESFLGGGMGSSELAMARYTLDETTPPPAQTPFGGTPWALPGVLEFEDFDNGGEGVAYHDTDAVNQGEAWRTTGVDIQRVPNNSNDFTLAFAKAGEWTEYTINAAQTGTYNVDITYASLKGGGKFHLEVDGKAVTPVITVKSTGDWQSYQTLPLSGINLTAGQHVLRLAMDGNDSTGYVANFNRARFAQAGTRSPFNGAPFIPNVQIEAEDYDRGGEGVAYHDTDVQNVGFSYRTNEGVDVQPAGDTGGGLNVGYAKASEWLIYSLNVQTPGTFGMQVRVASLKGGGRFHFEIDGRTVASFTAPNTGNWQKYVTLSSAKNISLAAGAHTLRLVMDANDS